MKLYTQIRLEAYREIDRWCIGIATHHPQLIGEDQAGCKELKEALNRELGDGEEPWEEWVWWQWIDERYRNWSSIIPTLHQECDVGSGEVMSYFAEKLASIAEVAVPIIDRYEGT